MTALVIPANYLSVVMAMMFVAAIFVTCYEYRQDMKEREQKEKKETEE